MVAGLYSIGQLATPIFEGLKISMKAYSGKNSENAVPREEKDIPVKYGLIIIICALIPLILYFFKIVNDIKVDIVLAVALIIPGISVFMCCWIYERVNWFFYMPGFRNCNFMYFACFSACFLLFLVPEA